MAEVQAHTCPRRMTELGPWAREANLDTWRDDDTCSFCGSLNPAMFMARLEHADCYLVPTDKDYKVYIHNRGGRPFRQTYRTDDDRTSDRSKWVWVTREMEETKFYFDHLTVPQRHRFIALSNAGKLALATPGYFYRLPFFVQEGPK